MAKGEGQGDGAGTARGKTERVAVPAMPMWLAITCCVLNFLIPGFGTIIAGFSTFCCARNEDMTAAKRVGSCCISFSIGLLQLLSVAILLLGWIWSCVWGVFFIGMSTEYYHDNPPDNTRGAIVTQPTAQSTVIVQPTVPGGSVYPRQQQQAPPWPQPAPQPAPQWNPQNQPQGYQGYGPHSNTGMAPYAGQAPYQPYGEPPPAYEEHQTTPSAPPAEKM